jgi:hypothetical protein
MAALTGLTGQVGVAFDLTAQKTSSGDISDANWPAQFSLAASITGIGTTTAGTANQIYVYGTTIAAGASLTIDLTAATNVFGVVSLARVKSIVICHDAASAASSIKWDTTVANSFKGWLTGTNVVIDTILPGEFQAVGGASANGKTVGGTTKIITITNNDGSNAASVHVGIIGAES